jgi:hypothetical protein
MDDRDLHRWEVKDSYASDWRALPGEFTAKEIWAMRARGDFWVSMITETRAAVIT